ncbi:heavy-metal-associated domain-containing protein [Candidatus Methanarcanum hacksteinii]|uniref:heavy-metal-associated domain-containing protein n=1 Tax=Candidatus Methanarcanum hacksteinii TaxID=2911857 RepID=UPI0026FFAB4E|nr:heavy-metal-associated domain-containing protein [Methanomassiliicoccales archaeon]MDO5838328.1 heavy metal-associated domain-containing protein [Methanomassiliicoccales archaeon]MDY4580343.1 heavy metal-associated domain-containing protein [Candidatus Methanarcanum hacksteinii]TQS76851.1 MAG: hypothetical protein A3204_05535 [Candidatus Methanarcanum hacksteinii]
MSNKTLIVDGMHCQKCQKKVEDALSAVDGVASVSVDLDKGKAKVELTKDVNDEDLCMAVLDAGFKAKVKHGLFK